MRVNFRAVVGRLAACVVLLASAASQQQRTPEEQLQFKAMQKFKFLVGKWSGNAQWFTQQGVLDLVSTVDVRYEQSGLILKIHGQERQSDGKPVGITVLFIFYDDKSNTYHIRTDANHKQGTLKLDDDWRGMTIQFKLPGRTTLEMLRVNEKDEWAEAHWVTEGSDPPWMFLQSVVRRQEKQGFENSRR